LETLKGFTGMPDDIGIVGVPVPFARFPGREGSETVESNWNWGSREHTRRCFYRGGRLRILAKIPDRTTFCNLECFLAFYFPDSSRVYILGHQPEAYSSMQLDIVFRVAMDIPQHDFTLLPAGLRRSTKRVPLTLIGNPDFAISHLPRLQKAVL
jgi:hypothetical protein